jgi:hypothetical protein
MNGLVFGDNLKWRRDKNPFLDASIKLAYLDRPFNPSGSYNVLFKEATERSRPSPASRLHRHVEMESGRGRHLCRVRGQLNASVIEPVKALGKFLMTSPRLAESGY